MSDTISTSNPNLYPDDRLGPFPRSLAPERLVYPEFEMATNLDKNDSAAMMKLVDELHEGAGLLLFLGLELIPEEILTIRLNTSEYGIVRQHINSETLYLGVCYKINERNNRTFGTIGIICKNLAFFTLRVMGYRRFEIVKVNHHRLGQTMAFAQIKIIKDITLTNPYNNLHLHPSISVLGSGKMRSNRDAWQTQWPPWVYKQFDVHELASCIFKKVKMLRENVIISSDPEILSFQLTRIGLFNDIEVNKLLSITSTNLRLQRELQYLNKIKIVEKYVCARIGCGVPICNKNNVFAMYPAPPQGSYQNCRWKNSTHSMITVTDLVDGSNILKLEKKSFECHCFPGYKSTSIFCLKCNSHLGWRFVIDCNVSLTPTVFYGLYETALKTHISSSVGRLVLSDDVPFSSRGQIHNSSGSTLLILGGFPMRS
ncbi:protein cereblon-like [Myzus persicae]|uniref:protein cereblon-like n=1 Tax=Myzus persicae TaxID=13164 RepID=UPI000B938419|nr:protein cereblon-like [Myzus persicae]